MASPLLANKRRHISSAFVIRAFCIIYKGHEKAPVCIMYTERKLPCQVKKSMQAIAAYVQDVFLVCWAQYLAPGK